MTSKCKHKGPPLRRHTWFSLQFPQLKIGTHVSASTESFVAFASGLQPKPPRHNNKLMNFNGARQSHAPSQSSSPPHFYMQQWLSGV